MNSKKIIPVCLALFLAASVLAGCTSASSAAAPSQSVAASSAAASVAQSSTSMAENALSVTDMKGRTATLEAPATKVVALSAADCEIVYALGAGEAMVGRGEYCNYPAEAESLPVVQSGSETNVEKIIELGPQVVLMNTMGQTVEQVEQLEKAGIVVLASEATDIEGVYEAITMIGAALGKDSEAQAMVTSMKDGFSALAQPAAAQGEAKTVYFEVSPLEYGLWTAGGGTFMDEIASLLGLENAFVDVTGWAEISEEQVLERNPDYIVTIAMDFGEGPSPDEEIMARAGWQGLAAVQNGDVFAISEDELSRPGPRLVDGAAALAAAVQGGASASSAVQSGSQAA